MIIKCLGGAKSVTGSSFLLEITGEKYLIDCGMFQGKKSLRERNYQPFEFNPAEIEYLILTHAHIDHSGLIPKLVREGFRGKILATCATLDLAKIMLPDSGHIQEMEAEWLNRKARRAGRRESPPLYTVEEAYQALEYFQEVNYDELYPLSPRVAVKFYDAGHILGSAIVKFWVTEEGRQQKLVFSGDLGKSNQPIIKDPAVVESADFLFMESTYGARLHEGEERKLEILAELIAKTYKNGGNVIIPAFAVGRTQEILYYLNKLIQAKQIPAMPIYIDSPLAISATEIFSCHPECYDLQMRQLLFNEKDPFNFPQVTFTPTVEESRQLNELKGGAIIISASGMADAGRIKHHLKHNLWRPESTVIMVGYQAEGTLGRRLTEGEKKVRIFGEEIAVKAEIANIHGFSAHADQEELLRWLKKFKNPPRQVYLVHGEEEAMETLAALIRDNFDIPVHIPDYMEEITIAPAGAVKHMRDIIKHLRAKEIFKHWEETAAAISRELERKIEQEASQDELAEAEKFLEELKEFLEKKAAV
ncbi:MAG TPA: MBL fold metallo-hydrolase [Firmicutes bacterium]|nr:MBL fold metallo-hydrolase [Bacillota bacterium]